MTSVNLLDCLENLRLMTEKETMKKQKYFKIKKEEEVKEEKMDMSGRNYLRNKQQYDFKMNMRKKNDTKKVREVVSNEEFLQRLDATNAVVDDTDTIIDNTNDKCEKIEKK